MNRIPEVRKFREEARQMIEVFCSWIEEKAFPYRKEYTPEGRDRRVPYRLFLFQQEYEKKFAQPYAIQDYAAEGGMAVRTQSTLLEDELYRQALHDYFQQTSQASFQKCTYLNFVRGLESWMKNYSEENRGKYVECGK